MVRNPPFVAARRGAVGRARHAPAPAEPTVWGRLLLVLLRSLDVVGLDGEETARALGLELEALDGPDTRAPLSLLYRLIELVVERTGDELAPLALGRTLDPSSLDAIGFLALSSSTLGAALDATLRYQRVFAEGERYGFERHGEHALVRYEPWGPARPAHAAWADVFARDVAVNMPALLGVRARGVRVRLRRAPPADRARYRELLGADVVFHAPVDEVTLPLELLALPIPRRDPMLAQFFARYLDERLAQLPASSVIARTLAVIDELLPGGRARLETVAHRLHASPRTLQRQLSAEGTSFAELVEQARRAKAPLLLESGVALAEIAWLLGFSEASALHRSFRRWTGLTPSAWRSAARQPRDT